MTKWNFIMRVPCVSYNNTKEQPKCTYDGIGEITTL